MKRKEIQLRSVKQVRAEKTINKIAVFAVSFLFIAVIVIGIGFLVFGEDIKTQAKETDTNTVVTEAKFYDIPIDIDLLDHIQGLCADYVIPVELVLAVIETESCYEADAVSPVGAIGLMQIIPEFHEDRMNRLNCTDLFDPYQNVTVGMDFLSELIDKYDGSFHKALTAYNYGQKGANDKFFGQGTYQTEYSLKVLETTEKIKKGMTEMFSDNYPVKTKAPKCSDCDEFVKGKHFYLINDEVICPDCLETNYKKDIEDYV